MSTTIVPLVVSLGLVIVVGVGLMRLRRRYEGEIEEVRLKYANPDNEFGIE